jgi:hypothetical protein
MSQQALVWEEDGVKFERVVSVERLVSADQREDGRSNHDGENLDPTVILGHVGRAMGGEGGWRRSSAADIFQHSAKAGHRRVNSLQQQTFQKCAQQRED